MDNRQWFEGTTLIAQHFGDKFPAESVKAAFEMVRDEPVEALLSAQKRVYVEMPTRPFPPIKRIVDMVIEEGKKHRLAQGTAIEDDWNRQKGVAPKFGRQNEEMAQMSLKLIEKIMTRRMSHADIVETMQRMDKRFPGHGWHDESIKLLQHYRGGEAI